MIHVRLGKEARIGNTGFAFLGLLFITSLKGTLQQARHSFKMLTTQTYKSYVHYVRRYRDHSTAATGSKESKYVKITMYLDHLGGSVIRVQVYYVSEYHSRFTKLRVTSKTKEL